MKKIYILLSLILILSTNSAAQAEPYIEIPKKVQLKVPFTSEIPNGSWVKPWNNACEEASIVMVEGYYYGYESTTKKIAMQSMKPLFKIQDKIFGSNVDTDTFRTAKLINNYTNFSATIKENPTLEDVRIELRNDRPVISMHYAKNLQNPNHHFRVGGSYYHVIVITGYDDETQEFIVNDSGDEKTGGGYRYPYEDYMKSLHDFNFKNHRADGPPRVLFTESKILFKTKNNPAVYLITHKQRHLITDPATFLLHGWKWKNIHVVDQKTLDKFFDGPMISS
ncbi:MAG: hypothetical protein ACD_72C00445G0001 [uncultured bacterium]|nr:MAG: hypothetical protein ACD_72C00445G0001 [uncultured bacterium]